MKVLRYKDNPSIVEEDTTELKNPLLNILDEDQIAFVETPSTKGDVEDVYEEDSNNEYREGLNGDNGEKEKDNQSSSKGKRERVEKVEKGINKDKLYVEILIKYYGQFIKLQDKFEGQLDSMIREGYREYKKGSESIVKLANKYISKSNALEKESDASFNRTLKKMKKELKENDLDTEIIKELNSYYKDYKEEKKLHILAKGKKAM